MSKYRVTCDGIDYVAYYWESPNVHIDLYHGEHKLACAYFHENAEIALLDYYEEDGGTIRSSSSSNFYFENIDKPQDRFIQDVGTYLASTFPGL